MKKRGAMRLGYRTQLKQGFTIVELLVVIVVIAILAAIIIFGYRGITIASNNALVASDLKESLKRIDVFYAKNGRTPSSGDLSAGQADDYKIKVSKRRVYAFLGYCTGKLNRETEIIMTAGTSDGKQFYISSVDGERVVKDVSADFNMASSEWGSYKCLDYLRPGSAMGENRDMIHRDGGVEDGYVTIVSS